MPPTRRVHVSAPYDVYCGRLSHVPFGWKGKGRDGRFGNYSPEGTVEAFRPWFMNKLERDPEYRREVEALRGLNLACFCRIGQSCHVDTIVDYLEGTAYDIAEHRGAPDALSVLRDIRRERG